MKTSRTGKMSGNGLMNDAWLAQTVKPSQARQAGHHISGTCMRTNVPCRPLE